MLVSEEPIQGLLLYLLSWFNWESDVFKNACYLSRKAYPQYAEMVCLDNIPNEEIKREISTSVYYPDGTPPFPGILLVSGSSPAMSSSMMERKAFFLTKGFAVMILNSYSRARVLEDCFRKDVPCHLFFH